MKTKLHFLTKHFKTSMRLSSLLGMALVLSLSVVSPFFYASHASAAVQNPTAKPRVSFTFDDGYLSALTQAQPTLSKYGLTGTDYVITGCVGMSTAPNTCRADNDAQYMTWAQIAQLQTAGWEIGSHTVTHPYLATSDATDGQPNVLTPAQVTQELTQSKSDLAAHGITATDFATPYGDYNTATLAQIAKLYATHRGFADQNNNTYPYNDLLLNDFHVQTGVTVAQVKAKIDAAIANNLWLVLTFHDIKTTASTNPDDFQYSTSDLDQIAAYVKSKQDAGAVQSVNVNKGPVTSDTNLLANSTFDSGIASGWTTDSPTNVVKDTANNGSYPSPTNSIKFTGTTKNVHLFSPKVAVDPATTYMLKNFVNLNRLTASTFAFFVDEYDANGNWISGQYKGGLNSPFVENYNFTYKPSSANVKTAALQVINPGNASTIAYFDNPQWFALSAPVTPPPPTNLLANGNFDNGIANGWTTDDATNITKDSANNGSPANPVNSIQMKSTTKNVHLFSPKVTVDATKTYTLTNYVNMKQITANELGFFIDEYDANGNWISGQYKGGVRAVSAADVSLQYKPTSANVKSAALQVISVSNSGILAYFDDARWFVN